MRAARAVAAGALALTFLGAVSTVLAAVWTPGFGWGGYLSALGAVGAPWRGLYSVGVAGAGLAIGLLAASLREVRPAAVLLAVSAVSFGGSAGVRCTPGCPLPVVDGFPWNSGPTWADTVHAGVSAVAFVAATAAMALLAARAADRVVRRVSAAAAVVLTTVMTVQLGWAVFVDSHGPVTGTTERAAALTAFLWTTGIAARLWWRPTACRTVESQEGDAMRLEHRFSVPAGPDETWALLCDVRAVESLVPGLSFDRIEPDEVTGALGVDVGGRRVTYRGEAAFAERDDAARSLAVEAAGWEATGGRPASATLTVALEPDGAATTVVLRAELDVAGGGLPGDRAAVATVVRRVVGEVAEGVAARFAPAVAAVPVRSPVTDPVHAGAPGGPHRLHGARHGAVAGDPVAAVDPVEPVDDIAPAAAPDEDDDCAAVVRTLRPHPARGAPRWTASPLAEQPRPAARPAARPPLRLVPPAAVQRAPATWERRGALALGVLLLLALLLWLARRLRS
jgi:carbon monoxide dehydrogenase subunit G/hypothetical membrane protein